MSIDYGMIIAACIVTITITGLVSITFSIIYEHDYAEQKNQRNIPLLETESHSEIIYNFKPSENLFDFIEEQKIGTQ